jgi:hypothetical protein
MKNEVWATIRHGFKDASITALTWAPTVFAARRHPAALLKACGNARE